MSNPPGQEVYALSCVNCRQRKVKCAKTYPCPHCVRGGLECVFPSRKKDRAPRRSKNHELLNRLAKLEAIVGQADPSLQAAAAAAASGSPGVPTTSTGFAAHLHHQQADDASAAEIDRLARNPQKRCPAAQPTSKHDPAAKYVSGEFWANLSTEVEGIKAALEQSSDSDDEAGDGDGPEETSPESGGPASYSSPSTYITSPAVFASAIAGGAPDLLRHPPPERMKRLRDLYFQNVDPLIKILHRPTVEREFDVFMINPENNPLSRTAEALFFAIYFAAVTSLTSESCQRQLGQDRALLVSQYRQGVELALARADYLNNTSLESLQALTLYDTCLRNHAESRASWALLGLVFRLAQAIGLHRDGDGSVFPPYEAEMRRRLWSQIIVLDVRAAQDRGTEPMIREDDSNTIPPTNVDDDAFNPDTTTPVPRLAVEGPTDVTFSLCTYHCSNLFLYIHAPRSKFAKYPRDQSAGAGAVPPQVTQASEDDIVARIKALEMQFVAPAATRPGHWPSALAAAVVRLTTLIFWLTIQYPFQVRQPTVRPRVSREHMLQTAVAVIELHSSAPAVAGFGLGPEEARDRFAWWQDGYVQWHPLAVALAELCVQTEGPLADRAWQTVDRVFPLWSHKVADARRGALWRPIRKLYRKARERRAEARLRRQRINNGEDPVSASAAAAAAVRKNKTTTPVVAGTNTTTRAEQSRPRPTSSSPAQPLPPQQVISPLAAATQIGPTGIPFSTDFGDMFSTPTPQAPTPATGMASATAEDEHAYGGSGGGGAASSMSSSSPSGVPISIPTMSSGTGSLVSPVAAQATVPPTPPQQQQQQQKPPPPPPPAAEEPAPPAILYSNAHQWTIDFGDLDLDVGGGGGGGGGFPPPPMEPQPDFEMMDWSAWNDFVHDANVNDGLGTSPSSEGK